MASLLTASQARGAGPPPSSILATCVVGTREPSRLKSDDFATLIAESLGADKNGEPNIVANVEINLKLLEVMLIAGVLPFIDIQTEDPFRKQPVRGENLEQLKKCIDVINLTIQRTPEVLFEITGSDIHAATGAPPLHAVLLVVSASFISQSKDPDLATKSGELLKHCLAADEKCSCGGCDSILDLHRQVLSGESAALLDTSMFNSS